MSPHILLPHADLCKEYGQEGSVQTSVGIDGAIDGCQAINIDCSSSHSVPKSLVDPERALPIPQSLNASVHRLDVSAADLRIDIREHSAKRAALERQLNVLVTSIKAEQVDIRKYKGQAYDLERDLVELHAKIGRGKEIQRQHGENSERVRGDIALMEVDRVRFEKEIEEVCVDRAKLQKRLSDCGQKHQTVLKRLNETEQETLSKDTETTLKECELSAASRELEILIRRMGVLKQACRFRRSDSASVSAAKEALVSRRADLKRREYSILESPNPPNPQLAEQREPWESEHERLRQQFVKLTEAALLNIA